MNAELRLDANETAYLNRQLEHIKSESYDVEYPKLSALEVFSIDTTTPPWAKTVTYEQYDTKGVAKIITDYTALPTIEVGKKTFTAPVVRLGDSCTYTVDDVLAGSRTGTPLPARKMLSIRDEALRYHNELWWLGDSAAGIVGVLTQANVPNSVVATGTGGTTWNTKTAAEIYADLANAVTEMIETTAGVERPNFIVMTAAKLQTIRTKRMGDNTGETVLSAFQKDHPEITFYTEELFKTAFTGGANGFLLGNNSRTKVELQAPIVFEMEPAEKVGLAFVVNGSGKNGGASVYKPFALLKKYGI